MSRIGVLEWNVACLGGRHRTMMAFADWFKVNGHQVTLYSNKLENPHPENFISQTLCTDLCNADVRWIDLKRIMTTVPDGWKALDVLLVPYGGYGHLQTMLPGVRIVTWVIHPAQARCADSIEVWTNSETSRQRLLLDPAWATSDPKVIIPPHSYLPFRESSRSWDRRPIDVIAVGTLLKSKGLIDSALAIKESGLAGCIVGMQCESVREEANDVLAGLRKIGVPTHVNLPSFRVAQLMGQSKCYLSMSHAESCSLSLYEALNAGCYPVTTDTGAAREQLDGHGAVIDPKDAVPAIIDAQSQSMALPRLYRGLEFDRSVIGHMALDAI